MGTEPLFKCPRCGAVSHHPDDVREGYCGRCHDWTEVDRIFLFSVELGLPIYPWQMRVIEQVMSATEEEDG